MAVIKLGSVVSDIRGSVGDETYSRNQGGPFVRARVTPTDPSSFDQGLARQAVSDVSKAWSDTLTEAQRESWRTYAGIHRRPDRWGQPKHLSGYVWFLRSNIPNSRWAQTIDFLEAPSEPPLGQLPFTFTAEADGPIDPYFVRPVLEPNVKLFAGLWSYVFIGNFVNPGVAYYTGPWVLGAQFEYIPPWVQNMTVPVDNPGGISGQRMFVKIRGQSKHTGAMSTPTYATAIIEEF